MAERRGPEKPLSPAELGKRSYGTITGLMTNLAATPEFNAALFTNFFGMTSSNDHKRDRQEVYYYRGDYGYFLRFSKFDLRATDVEGDSRYSVYFYVSRFDITGLTESERNQPPTVYNRRDYGMSLTTTFVRGESGEIKEYAEGGVSVSEYTHTQGPSRQEVTAAAPSNTVAAYDKIPQLFPGLYPAPVTL